VLPIFVLLFWDRKRSTGVVHWSIHAIFCCLQILQWFCDKQKGRIEALYKTYNDELKEYKGVCQQVCVCLCAGGDVSI